MSNYRDSKIFTIAQHYLFLKDIRALEAIQRRVTRLVHNLAH